MYIFFQHYYHFLTVIVIAIKYVVYDYCGPGAATEPADHVGPVLPGLLRQRHVRLVHQLGLHEEV